MLNNTAAPFPLFFLSLFILSHFYYFLPCFLLKSYPSFPCLFLSLSFLLSILSIFIFHSFFLSLPLSILICLFHFFLFPILTFSSLLLSFPPFISFLTSLFKFFPSLSFPLFPFLLSLFLSLLYHV